MQVISFNNQYATAPRRLMAFVIDHLVVSTVFCLLSWDFSWSLLGLGFWKLVLVFLYYAQMESSRYQATIGKIAMGIKVTDEHGQRLDFSKALLRNLSKILSSAILGIGYIMILFDERNQGLHDKIADTLVVKQ
ncbi:MAG TPA: RDD family protein [Chitinophagales bacterium]|nr:RDD family protein [Chitinophagales bacterium]HLP50294.1 RDD family protein [Chitinophagales bacterium]